MRALPAIAPGASASCAALRWNGCRGLEEERGEERVARAPGPVRAWLLSSRASRCQRECGSASALRCACVGVAWRCGCGSGPPACTQRERECFSAHPLGMHDTRRWPLPSQCAPAAADTCPQARTLKGSKHEVADVYARQKLNNSRPQGAALRRRAYHFHVSSVGDGEILFRGASCEADFRRGRPDGLNDAQPLEETVDGRLERRLRWVGTPQHLADALQALHELLLHRTIQFCVPSPADCGRMWMPEVAWALHIASQAPRASLSAPCQLSDRAARLKLSWYPNAAGRATTLQSVLLPARSVPR